MEGKLLSHKSVERISQKMDEYIDTNNAGLEKYCRMQHDKKCESPFLAAQLYYVIGTGYSAVHSNRVQADWYSPSIGNAVYFLRKALHELKKFKDEYYEVKHGSATVSLSYAELYSRININLANYLTEQSRHIEALEFYDRAIALKNAFGHATKARCLIKFNEDVYDENAHFFLSKKIYNSIQEALKPESTTIEGDEEQFVALKKRLESYLPYFEDRYAEYIDSDHSDTHQEHFRNGKHKSYCNWVGKNRIFLNMSNLVIIKEYAYEDCLSLPSFSGEINSLLLASEELSFHAHFDELKDTYCYARYTYYTALNMPIDTDHVYNSSYKKVNSLDYSINSFKTNQYKTALRCLYSLLDKIAYFIYKFFEVSADELEEHEVTIRTIFITNKKPAAWFSLIKNPFLSALYFLSKDINDVKRPSKRGQIQNSDEPLYLSETTFPAANHINQIRNALEHKSLKIVDGFAYEMSIENYNSSFTLDKAHKKRAGLDESSDAYQKLTRNIDEKNRLKSFHLTVSVDHIEEQILELIKLSRNALMYLALSIQYHESHKPADVDSEKIRLEREVPYL
ncbi:LA2681 family HEPN domain-containing protein [Pseudomonas sp. DG56-2]|uniref:LA2681 family HEPN domain-containing protein n=1 Tax=Pseudomonas sp. DG56-2 TaxID=2320270 RepID=UPI0010A6577E|nr:LA2681 family HEPN domain-containing protein [Pseudomonas sp. DG56-2]